MRHFIIVAFLVLSWAPYVGATQNNVGTYIGFDVSLPVLSKTKPDIWNLRRNPNFALTIGQDLGYMFTGLSYNQYTSNAKTEASPNKYVTQFSSKMLCLEIGKEFIRTFSLGFFGGIAGGVAWNKIEDVYKDAPVAGGSSGDVLWRSVGARNTTQPMFYVFLSTNYKVHRKLSIGLIVRYVRMGKFRSAPGIITNSSYPYQYNMSIGTVGVNVRLYL